MTRRQILRVRPALLVAIIVSTALYGISNITAVHAAGPLTGNFTINPQYILAGGNDSFTATVAGGTSPYQLLWTFGDGTPSVSNHTSSTGSYQINATTTTTSHITTTSITCAPGLVNINSPTSCSATIRDISTTPITPTGPVSFTSNGVGTFSPLSTCTLTASATIGIAACSLTYTAMAATGVHTITGIYPPDGSHVGTSSGKFPLFVTTPSTNHQTTTSVSCNAASVNVLSTTTCTAVVTDFATSPTKPVGVVQWATDSAGTFNQSPPQCNLSQGSPGSSSISICSIKYTPTSAGSGTHTITATYVSDSGIVEDHTFAIAGSFTVTLLITDSASSTTTVTHIVPILGTPLLLDGWLVNWNITANWGIRVSNITYNGVPVIRDAFINGILVGYWPSPPGQTVNCLFFDNLGSDDLAARPGGLSLQYSSDPSNPWFQIRTQFQPGYNYTEIWRFYQSGQWDAILYVGHLGCGWNHYYQPHFRIDLAIGNKNANLMGQYSPSGVWRNLIWEGNYTDNASRDPSHNMTEWRLGDGRSYYYFVPSVTPWAKEMPRITPKIYLVRDRPGEIEPNPPYDIPSSIPDPIIFANGELAYRQSIAIWYLPSFWDHWTGLSPGYNAPPSMVRLSFYPSGI